MQKVKTFFVLILTVTVIASFIRPAKEKINWLSLQQVQEAYKKQPRPILVDVYTDWCGWCKVMDKETYSKEHVAAYINEHYYAVKFNAESRDSAMLGSKKYGYNSEYRSNDLAVYLLFGQMSFPSTVFLSTPDARPAPLPGYMKPSELEAPLKYFGDGNFQKQDYPQFMKDFKSSW